MAFALLPLTQFFARIFATNTLAKSQTKDSEGVGMKRAQVVAVLIFAALLLPAAGTASVLPNVPCGPAYSPSTVAYVLVNGTCFDLSGSVTPGVGFQSHLDTIVTSGGGSVHIRATFDTDPFISFGTTTTNLIAAPTTYSFLFGTPITPGVYSIATSTGGVTVTNGVGGTATVDNSSVYPTFISGYGTVGGVPTNLGVDLGTAPCVAGPGTPFTVTTVCNQGTTSNTFAPTFYDNLEALLTYTQDDIGSVASWSGAITIDVAPEPVPEPASVLLLGTGVLCAGLVRRLRRGV